MMRILNFYRIGFGRFVAWAALVAFAFLPTSSGKTGAEQRQIWIVENGTARAVVVTADTPTPVTRMAAQDLVEILQKSSGAELEIVSESDPLARKEGVSRIFLGRTQASERLDINPDAMKRDAFLLRTDGTDVYILGKDGGSEYSRYNGMNGTLNGVYEFLERTVDVLWLWPGELGTYIPPKNSISIQPADDLVEMDQLFRHFRYGHLRSQIADYRDEVKRLAFTREGLENYYDELHRFYRRNRLGWSERRPWLRHRGQRLWNEFGEKHPEWFAMNIQGVRVGPSLCVSNRGLHEYLVGEGWDGMSNIYIDEADVLFTCECSDCLAWDKPLPDIDNFRRDVRDVRRRITSNRYARFAEQVRNLARRRNPDGDYFVCMYVYMTYFPIPSIEVDLEGVHGDFCPWGAGFTQWYPMTEEEDEFLKKTWLGWKEKGMVMLYRPNYLLGGYVMPHLDTWRSGEMLRFVAEHGSRGHDFDSLRGHWAAKGPMLYIHIRLASDPSREIADLRREYFSAFGPAAGKVEEYFDYWENYSAETVPPGGVSWSNASNAHAYYPPEVFEPAAAILDSAGRLAARADSAEYADRVKFLKVGLEHAVLAAEFTRKLQYDGIAAGRKALLNLIDFRREHEHLYFSDFVAAALPENRGIDIGTLLDDEFSGVVQPWEGWRYRKDPDNRGVEERWFEPVDGPVEGRIRISDDNDIQYTIDEEYWVEVPVPARLGDTAVGDYLGYGWYVTFFEGPEEWRGRPVELRFGAVDEQAWVYINGQYVGEHTVESEGLSVSDLWRRSFSIEVSEGIIRDRGKNILVVRTHASGGASGIWRPVSADAMY